MIEVKPIRIDWNHNLSIYASEIFLKLVGDEYGWLGGFDRQGILKCILPYTIIKYPLISMARFRIETIPRCDQFSLEEEKEFLNKVVDYFRNSGVDLIIPPSTNTVFRTFPDYVIAAPYGTFIIDLTKTEEALWKELHQNNRNKIRQALKNDITIKEGILFLDTSYQLIKHTFKRAHMNFMSYDKFKKFILSLQDNIKILVAVKNKTIEGCLVAPYSRYSAYTLYSGRIPQSSTGSMNLLRWESIRLFKCLGVERFNSVGVRINPEKGSKQESLLQYKKSFGGNLIEGYMWKVGFNPIKYSIYSLGVKLLRGGDIIDHERHKLHKL